MTTALVSLGVAVAASVGGLIALSVLVHQWARLASSAQVDAAEQRGRADVAERDRDAHKASRDELRARLKEVVREIDLAAGQCSGAGDPDLVLDTLATARRIAADASADGLPADAAAGDGSAPAAGAEQPGRLGALSGAVGRVLDR